MKWSLIDQPLRFARDKIEVTAHARIPSARLLGRLAVRCRDGRLGSITHHVSQSDQLVAKISAQTCDPPAKVHDVVMEFAEALLRPFEPRGGPQPLGRCRSFGAHFLQMRYFGLGDGLCCVALSSLVLAASSLSKALAASRSAALYRFKAPGSTSSGLIQLSRFLSRPMRFFPIGDCRKPSARKLSASAVRSRSGTFWSACLRALLASVFAFLISAGSA